MFRVSWNTYIYTNGSLEANISKVFDKLELHVDEKDIQACHRLKDNDRAIIKLSNREDNLQVFRVKKDVKSLDPTELRHENLYK